MADVQTRFQRSGRKVEQIARLLELNLRQFINRGNGIPERETTVCVTSRGFPRPKEFGTLIDCARDLFLNKRTPQNPGEAKHLPGPLYTKRDNFKPNNGVRMSRASLREAWEGSVLPTKTFDGFHDTDTLFFWKFRERNGKSATMLLQLHAINNATIELIFLISSRRHLVNQKRFQRGSFERS